MCQIADNSVQAFKQLPKISRQLSYELWREFGVIPPPGKLYSLTLDAPDALDAR